MLSSHMWLSGNCIGQSNTCVSLQKVLDSTVLEGSGTFVVRRRVAPRNLPKDPNWSDLEPF